MSAKTIFYSINEMQFLLFFLPFGSPPFFSEQFGTSAGNLEKN
jgi:hypothetical protein